MSLSVIGFGVGRTGTYSLKLALEQLGFGPCHHMEEVDWGSGEQVARWAAAARGEVDWETAYAGYRSAVDWPTAAFCRELAAAYPEAKILLTIRDSDKWVESFSNTIALLAEPGRLPPEFASALGMLAAILAKTGFSASQSRTELLAAFDRHTAMVRATVPVDRLLVFDVREGWDPLCGFLGVPVPATPFPRTNSTPEFWESAKADADSAVAAP